MSHHSDCPKHLLVEFWQNGTGNSKQADDVRKNIRLLEWTGTILLVEQLKRLTMFAPSNYLHPRYWPSWFGFGLLRLVSLLPLPVIALLGSALGTLVFHLMKSRRKIAVQNLVACFPEVEEAQHQHTAKRCFQLIAITTLNMGVNWWASPQRLERLVRFEGKEHYDQAIADGRNIILLAPHAIALEMAGLMLSRERSMITMYQATRKPLLNEIVKDRRGRFGGILVERRAPLRNLLRLIRQGNPFYYLPDQDAGDKGVFVPFFGVEASTFPVLSKFAKVSDAVVLPCFTHILPNGAGWHVIIGEPLSHFPGEDELEDARRMNEAVEKMVRRAPEQYFWVHKRFKTRPSGEQDFYQSS